MDIINTFGKWALIWLFRWWILALIVCSLIWAWLGGLATGFDNDPHPERHRGASAIFIDPFTMWKPLSESRVEAAKASYVILRYPDGDHAPFRAYIAILDPTLTIRQLPSEDVYLLEYKEVELKDCWLGRRLWRICHGKMQGDQMIIESGNNVLHPYYYRYDASVQQDINNDATGALWHQTRLTINLNHATVAGD